MKRDDIGLGELLLQCAAMIFMLVVAIVCYVVAWPLVQIARGTIWALDSFERLVLTANPWLVSVCVTACAIALGLWLGHMLGGK